jgi:aminoglycoside phosphotransferase family enzyme/predicted kinase
MPSNEQRVVRFLSRPSSYPHPAGRILRRETHVSHVFLAGSFAYKLKKPVKFPFLDASTLALRKKFCRLELSLNRRLAPNVYLGIVPVVETRDGLRLGRAILIARHSRRRPDGGSVDGQGRVVEWLVKMRRLPEERMLDQLVQRGRVNRQQIRQVADQLIPFFRRAARSDRLPDPTLPRRQRRVRSRSIDHYGRPKQVRALVLGNLQECRPFVGTLLTETDHKALESAYRQYLALHEPLLARRVREGRIIDGHGDLRCENICMTRPVSVFDCVEFQPAFRCGDIANDFSFLLMDLEFRGRPDLAGALASSYRRQLDDPAFDRIVAFYKCHRSLVRGKVRGLAWQQHPRTAQGRRVRELARRHFRLARHYAAQFAPPRLIVVGGVIGTGKSTLAESLTTAFGARLFRTDEIRLKEFAHYRRPRQGFAGGLYAPRVSELVYQRLIHRAEALVRRRESVICDGTFSLASGRRALRRIAARHGASFHFFECVVPRHVALARVAKRSAAGVDISEGRPEHYDRLKAGFEPVRGWPADAWTRISDNRPPQATYHAALEALRRAWKLPTCGVRHHLR